MADIKFGVTYSERADFTDLPAYAKRVEELGLDSIWVTENIGSRAPALECFTALSFMAAHTSKLMVGTSVMLLPLRNPVMVAQTVASLDILSGGRAVLGVGVGNEGPDLKAYGGNVRHRASWSDEALEVIKRLWTEDSVTFHGKHFDLDEYQLVPKPVQKPHPRIHVGGGAASVVRRAGRFADSLIPVSKTPEESKAMFERAEEHSAGVGAGRLGDDEGDAPVPVLLGECGGVGGDSIGGVYAEIWQLDDRARGCASSSGDAGPDAGDAAGVRGRRGDGVCVERRVSAGRGDIAGGAVCERGDGGV